MRSRVPTTPLAQHEFDALVSFAYNVGLGGFGSSSVHKDLVSSPPAYGAVPGHLLKWVYSGDTPLCGLHRRRTNEGNLFRSGVYAITTPTCPYR